MKRILQSKVRVSPINLPQDGLTLAQTGQTLVRRAGHEDLDAGGGLEGVEAEGGAAEDELEVLDAARARDWRYLGRDGMDAIYGYGGESIFI